MKKYVSAILTVLLLLSLVGCSENSLNMNENNANASQNEASTVASSQSTLVSPPAPKCAIIHGFWSIEDLHTYVTTGSKNLEDYRFPPITSLSIMPSLEFIQEYGYIPISEVFDFDETTFENVEAYFRMSDEFISMEYYYVLDDICITTQYVGTKTEKTTLDFYKQIHKNDFSIDSKITADSNVTLRNGYSVRTCGEYEVVYTIKDNVVWESYVLIDGYLISVNACGYSYAESAEQAFSTFMTSPKYAAFSPLFSDDQETFEAAVMGMAQPKGEVE